MTDETTSPAARLRRRAERRLRGVARRLRDDSPLRRVVPPAVTVVLPFYNVEAYIGACLDSIAAQTFRDYEVLAVDDGSPDGSRAIVEEHAARDRRIRLITRPNGGLGAARNTGVDHARGRFLVFVDSDDLLPEHALAVLVESARRTGSDVVVGSVMRFIDEDRSWRPSWVPAVHSERREGIRVGEFLPLLRNLYTWAKLFRRDFFVDQGLRFREGVAYEDQPIITQLYVRARAIDVLTDVVYHYRARADQSSISQQTGTVADLQSRAEAWQISHDVLLREAPTEIYVGWLQTLFEAHFHWYLTSPGTVDDEYWTELHRAVVRLTEGAPRELWHNTSPPKRVLIELARQDRRADATEFARLEADKLDRWPATVREDGILLHLPYQGDPDLDDELFLLHPDQIRLSHTVENVHWSTTDAGGPVLHLSGWAFLRKVDLATHTSETHVVLVGPDGVEHAYPATSHPEPSFDPPQDDAWCDYGPGAYAVEVPVHELVAGAAAGARWEVLLRVAAAGLERTIPVTHLLRSGSAGMIPAVDLPDGGRVVAEWRHHEPLRLRHDPLVTEIVEVALADRTLSGRLAGPGAGAVEQVVVRGGAQVVTAEVGGRGTPSFRVTLPRPAELEPGEAVQWELTGRLADGSPAALSLRGGSGLLHLAEADGRSLGVQRNRNGELSVLEQSLGAVAETLEVTGDGVVRVTGRVLGPGSTAARLVVRHKKTRTEGPEVGLDDGRFALEVPLTHELYRFGTMPLPIGDHDLGLRVLSSAGYVEVPLRMSADVNALLPITVHTDVLHGRIVRGPASGVMLSLLRPTGEARGRYRQNRFRTAPPTGKVTRGLLLRSYFGEHATDNGLSIQKVLRDRGSDLPVYWAVQDHSVPVPEGGIPVVVNTREYYELITSVSYYVDNMYQPDWFTKPDHQVLVQTFHGYPFKQMGHPHWENMHFSQAKIDAYDARAAQWDHLVSPARYASPLLARDFHYDGNILEIGYPRNDVLQSPEAEGLRATVRASLGLRDDQTAVLYAPTFRDYLAVNDNRAKMADFFDFAEAHARLGDGYVMLIRGHAFNARARARVGPLPGTIDVTDYPEVSDLYLAADAAVVDYSSLRFDFGVTGKPMVFHVPDLQRYKDTRGWLFDFEPTAPGPFAETTAEVVEQLLDLDAVRREHAEAYARFRADFLDLEDGHAGDRFVDAVIAPRGDA